MKSFLMCTLTAVCASAALANVTVEKIVIDPSCGWPVGQWGKLHITFKNESAEKAQGCDVKTVYKLGDKAIYEADSYKLDDLTIDPGKTHTWSPWFFFDRSIYESTMPANPTLYVTVTMKIAGKIESVEIQKEIQPAFLPEPLKLFRGKNVGFEFMESRLKNWPGKRDALRWVDQSYDAMADLVGGKPRGGKLLVFKETPPIPAVAYSSDPIGVNTAYIQDAIDRANRGIIPFAWIHEMGHVFDLEGMREWYSWGTDTTEFQANLKLGYCYEVIEDQSFRALFHDSPRSPWKASGEYDSMSGRDFMTATFMFCADGYLADPSRTWDTLIGDEWHSFFLRIIRVHGWDTLKGWYRTYNRLHAAGLKPPKTADEKVNLMCAILSQEAGVDLIPAFQQWRMPVTEESIAAIKAQYPIEKGNHRPIDPKDLGTPKRATAKK